MMEKSDRDSSQAQMAEDEFQAMLLKYPQSPFAPQAEQRLREVQEVLADGEYKIAHFYYTKQDYRASAARIMEVVSRYPLYSQSDEALWMLGDIYTRIKVGSKNEDQRNYWTTASGKVYAQIVQQYPLSPRAQEAKGRLKEMGLPVPASNPDAVIRMQKERDYEKQHHESALMRAPKNMLHGAPDVSLAAHNGQPNLNPPDDAVAASEILKPNSGAGFNLSGSASSGGAADSSPASSGGATKHEDAPSSQATVESGPGGGTTLGVQILTHDSNIPSGNTSANPPAAGSEQPGPVAAPSQPAANSADSGGSAPPAEAPAGTPSSPPASAPSGSNGQPAGTQAASQASQSASDSSSSSSDSQTATPAQSSSSDDSKDSTSKKKKGARKLIPW
jgi:outer membrane protein assembly factor BamD